VATTTHVSARLALALVVACSFVVRGAAVFAHPRPRFFPDEYLYTELARSLAEHGRPLIRGEPASFPALLEPLLAAPFQAFFSPEHAYRLTQLESALFMSAAAIPAYLLARRLSLSERYALFVAVMAVAIPDLIYAAYTMADGVAYPLALGAVVAGVVAVERPARRSQVAFLVLASLTVFARVQYVVLFAAFIAAAVVVDRSRVFRTQRLVFVLVAVPVAAAAVVGLSRVLGYYSNVTNLHVGTAALRWAAINLFLLTLVTGVVIVPGALVALARPRGRTELAFAAFAGIFIAGLVAEAAVYAANGSGRFQERYLFAALPLLVIAFGIYLKHRRPAPAAVIVVASVVVVAAARLPLSIYTAGTGKISSPFLFGVYDLERQIGVADASLVVALLATLAAAGAAAVARWGGARAATVSTLVVAAAASFGSFHTDKTIETALIADTTRTSWVDDAGLGRVTLVQTHGSDPSRAITQLYWNRSIEREVLLGDALPTDTYSAPRLRIDRNGALVNTAGPLLFHGYGTTARFVNADVVAAVDPFTLYTFRGKPRLALVAEGRYEDGWLAPRGRLTVWPGTPRGAIQFALSLPRGADPVALRMGRATYHVRPGRTTRVRIPVRNQARWSTGFSASRGSSRGRRIVSVRSTIPTFVPAPTHGR
jgi:hypothetical protein